MRTVLVMVVMCLVVAGCSDEPDAAPGTTSSASPGAGDEASANPDRVNIGWIIVGPDGTEFDITETVTSNGGDVSNSYTYTLTGGQSRESLYTQFVDAVTIEVTVNSGGPVMIDMVRGTLAADGFSVDVVETLESREVAAGASATMTAER